MVIVVGRSTGSLDVIRMSRPSMQEETAPILDRIGRALIEGTPEHWRAIQLELTTTYLPDGSLALANTVTSPEGHREPVRPSDELLAATHQLQTVHERWERRFERVRFTVAMVDDGDWDFKADWSYE